MSINDVGRSLLTIILELHLLFLSSSQDFLVHTHICSRRAEALPEPLVEHLKESLKMMMTAMIKSCEYMKSNNAKEEVRVPLMRALVEKQDPSYKEADDTMLRRFLRARDLDIEKASDMFLRYLEWRQTFVPGGSISVSEVPNELAQNKVFLQGFDKVGRPVAVVLGARHFQNKLGLEEFKRFVAYTLDKICSRMPPGQEKFVVIGDLKDWGYSNSDLRAYLGALSILQDYYPERLGKMFIVHAPYIFMTVWKVIYPFIDNKTKKKIMFVEDKKLTSTLLQEIDESQIPEEYGGQLPLVPIQEA